MSKTGSGIVCECSRHSPRVPGYLCMRDAFEMLLSILWMDVVVDYYVQQHIGSFGYHPSTSLLEGYCRGRLYGLAVAAALTIALGSIRFVVYDSAVTLPGLLG